MFPLTTILGWLTIGAWAGAVVTLLVLFVQSRRFWSPRRTRLDVPLGPVRIRILRRAVHERLALPGRAHGA